MGSPYHPGFYDIATPESILDDVTWYRAQARAAGGPVLELGSGTGRITIPMAKDGASICALDADPAMLDALRQRLGALPADVRERVTLIEGDMRSFTIEQRFALAIAPFRNPQRTDLDELVIEARRD